MLKHLRAILAAGLIALCPLPAIAASLVWNAVPAPVFKVNGTVAAGAKAYFYLAGTTTPITAYSDSAQTTPFTQPVVASAVGVFSAVYIPYSSFGYRVKVTTSDGVTISDTDGIARDAPPSSGGGGGITVSTEQILQPGWTMWLPQTGTVTGFVRMNGRTIGSATSGATERANADTASLYSYLWTNCADAQCPVSTGRGASAAADFAANKTITLLDLRGRAPFGLDDMGNSAANRIQRSPTITTTSGSPTATVSSASGLTIGMKIVSANVPAGTTITDISGTTITMSANASASAGPTAARFSVFSDSQTPGTVAGEDSHTQLQKEVGVHSHTITDPGHVHLETTTAFSSVAQAGGTANVGSSAPAINTGSAMTGITINNSTGGLPFNVLPPGALGGWYQKL